MAFRTTGVFCVASLLGLACGSSHDDKQDLQNNPTYKVGDGTNLNVTFVGGKAAITDAQYTDVKGSACAGWAREGENLPALLDFVVDVSGSMGLTAPTTNGRSKWAITKEALQAALDGLPGSTAVGMIFFPNVGTQRNTVAPKPDPSSCLNTSAMIPIGLLGDASSVQRTALKKGIEAAKAAGGTPTDDAYEYELANNMNKSQLPGLRFMVLITDGQPTFLKGCFGTGNTSDPVDYQPVVDAIKNAAPGVKTFIIGSPGSEAQASTGADGRGWLSHAATVGQTPLTPTCSDSGPSYCHFDMAQAPDFAAGFSDALAQIAGQVVSCSYTIPPPPAGKTIDPAKINVILTTGVPEHWFIQRAASSACTEGWFLDSNNNVVLCSETCKAAKADTTSTLDLLFGCATFGNPLT